MTSVEIRSSCFESRLSEVIAVRFRADRARAPQSLRLLHCGLDGFCSWSQDLGSKQQIVS